MASSPPSPFVFGSSGPYSLQGGYSLPNGLGTSGQYLQTDGAGGSVWASVTADELSAATPELAFKDTDCTDSDDNVVLRAQATDTGSGTEDVDFSILQQINGTLTERILFDADGETEIKTGEFIIPTNAYALRFGTLFATSGIGSSDGWGFQINSLGGLVFFASNSAVQSFKRFDCIHNASASDVALAIGHNTTADQDNGFYRPAANQVMVSNGGTDTFLFTGTYVEAKQPLRLPTYTNAGRPAAGNAGTVIFNTDDGQLNIDDGTNWTLPDGTTT